MTAAELTAELQDAGVHLWEDDGRLRFRAPRGVMTPARVDALRDHKAEVLATLRRAGGGGAAAVVARPEERHEPFPLTDIQAAYLVGRSQAFEYGGVGCHGYGELHFDALDVARLQRAWNATVARHDMLRAVIDPDGSQRVLPAVEEIEIPVVDCRGGGDADDALRATREAMAHRVYTPDQWPLFDLRVTAGDAGSTLHFSLDFLVADLVSLQLILGELQARYEQPGAVIEPLPISFRDYCAAEQGQRRGEAYERDRAYWWERLDRLPPAPELPTRTASREGPVRFERHALRLDPARWGALRERTAAHGLSPSTAVLAAYAETLGRWAEQPRFTLDVTLLNRLALHPAVNELVGDFTSVELLEVAGDGASFAERARTLQAQLWQDMDHRRCTGVEVLREIARRHGRQAAMFPIVFTSSIGVAAPGEAWGELGYGISQTPQVSIDCQAMERGGALELNWDVRQGVFPAGLVDAMFAAFSDLLDRLIDEDAAWSAASPLRLPAGQLAQRAAANATSAPLPDGLLHQGVLEQAERAPDRPAVLTADAALSYGELVARARAVAAEIVRRDPPRDRPVAVMMDKGPEQVIAVLGILLAGRAYLPIDTVQPQRRAELMLQDAGAALVLTQSWVTAPGRVATVAVDRLGPAGDVSLPAAAHPDDLAYVIYTSGSTGTPKGVAMSHRAALNTLDDMRRRYGLDAGDRVLGLSNLGFDLSVYDVFATLATGAALVMPDHARRTDPSHWAALLDAHGVTVWNTVPALMEMLATYLEAEPRAEPLALRLVLLSGDWIPVTLPARIADQAPATRTVSLGGATEAAIWSIAFPIDEVDPAWKSIPYGRPLTNQRFHVLDARLEPAPDLVAGDLYIAGDGLALGYFGDSQRTAERFVEHPAGGERLYRTGDRGRYLPDGTIEFLGRVDAQVKVHGHRIELAEIEAALLASEDIASAAAVVGGEGGTRRLAAFVEPDRAGRAPEPPAARLEAVARDAAGAVAGGIDTQRMLDFARQLDETALLGMLRALREAGIFTDTERAHSADEILEAAQVAPRHRRLIRRWLHGLQAWGLVVREADGRLRATRVVDAAAVDAAWEQVHALRLAGDTRTELVDYFREAGEHLPELMRGDEDPLDLLFPEGRTEIHEVAYRENVLGHYLNQITASVLGELAGTWDGPGPFRVLEVGAGVGGTSVELIEALDDHDAEYLFTDVSPFFLNQAAERFADRPWVRCRPFDINAGYREQGLAPNSFGAIVCANVMHYAHDARVALQRIRELLMPGGCLLFIETTRDNYQILTSMEFLFDATVTEFQDVRKGRDETFIARDDWLDLLAQAGAQTAVCLPDTGEPLAAIGMFAFAARFKPDRRRIDPAGLRDHLREYLPEYMVPTDVEVVDALPVTENGKVDRGALRELVRSRDGDGKPSGDAAPPEGELEIAVAEVWAAMLGAAGVGRDEDFFALGGDSLVAAQIVARTRETVRAAAAFQYDELLRILLEDPTVAAFARAMDAGPAMAAGDGGPARPSPIVVLSADEPQGTAQHVLVHDATGGLEGAEALAAALGDVPGLLGLTVVDAAAYCALPAGGLIEELAEEYAERLLERGRDFHLIGHRGGGLLAAETAIRLMEAGAQVRLSVIAGVPVDWGALDETALEYLLARELAIDPEDLGFPGEAQVAAALAAREPLAPELAELPGATRMERWEAAGYVSALAYLDVFAHSLAGFADAPPSLYAGDVTVLRPTGETPLRAPLRDALTAFWEERCLGDVQVVDIPGDLFSCSAPERADDLADALRAVVAPQEAVA